MISKAVLKMMVSLLQYIINKWQNAPSILFALYNKGKNYFKVIGYKYLKAAASTEKM